MLQVIDGLNACLLSFVFGAIRVHGLNRGFNKNLYLVSASRDQLVFLFLPPKSSFDLGPCFLLSRSGFLD